MRYLSPTSLPDRPSINPPDKKALQLQRRKLLTELELSADGYCVINDRPFSKNDLLEYFETLQEDTILYYHAEVSKDEVLTGFLEQGQLLEDASFLDSDLYTNPEFLQWISPYFHTAFTQYVAECLQNIDETGLHTILRNHLLMTDYDREQAWILIGQSVENRISRLEDLLEPDRQPKPVPTLADLFPEGAHQFIRMIVALPEGPFTGLRNKYAAYLMQGCILVFNKEKDQRDLILGWMEYIKRLAVSEELVRDVEEKIAEMERLRRKSDSGMTRVAIFIGIILLKFLLFNSHSPSSYDPPKFTKFTYVNGKDTTTVHGIKELDSLLHQRKPGDSPQSLRFH